MALGKNGLEPLYLYMLLKDFSFMLALAHLACLLFFPYFFQSSKKALFLLSIYVCFNTYLITTPCLLLKAWNFNSIKVYGFGTTSIYGILSIVRWYIKRDLLDALYIILLYFVWTFVRRICLNWVLSYCDVLVYSFRSESLVYQSEFTTAAHKVDSKWRRSIPGNVIVTRRRWRKLRYIKSIAH